VVYAGGFTTIRKWIMIVHRRTWLYRLLGEREVRSVTFKLPLTSAQARQALRQSVGEPVELWGRSPGDLNGNRSL